MNAYLQASLIVEGALDEEREFPLTEAPISGYAALDKWLNELRGEGTHGEVFVIEHGHGPNVEDCGCVQYLTDHHPYATI